MSLDQEEMPGNWDALTDREPSPDSLDHPAPPPPEHDFEPPVITLMAVSWADLVSVLAVCACALIAVLALGERPTLPAFGWAAVLALAWWAFAASVLIVIRHGTPGMLLAGVAFNNPVPPPRVPWVLTAALVSVVLLGLPGVLGGRRSLLAVAAESEIVSALP